MAMNSSYSKKQAVRILNPPTESYEFCGPLGALLVTLGTPFLVYALFFICNDSSQACSLPTLDSLRQLHVLLDMKWWISLWDMDAAILYLAWYLFCVVAWIILPGRWIEGLALRTGVKKSYKVNGYSTFLVSVGLTLGYIFYCGPEFFTFLYGKWVGFITASLLMSLVQSLYCYISSFYGDKLLALGGNTGNVVYDFFIGRELNPSIGLFDIKSFNEIRPGMILWALLDISMVCEQAVRRGGFSQVTDSMWLVVAFQCWYIADSLYNESAIFSVMDITTDGFGFMLAFGDLTWVPFVFSIQARYLVFNQLELGLFWIGIIFGFNLLGYYIFRTANGDKNDVRSGRNPKNLKFLQTERGTKLIVSGWWGRSRHPNYFGDLIMALAWSLPTGINTPVTYVYVTYFTVLLIHRQIRDDENCKKKYGKDWDKYVKMVPWRIVPYVY